MLQKLNKIFSDLFGIDFSDELHAIDVPTVGNLNPVGVEKWDSLGHLELMLELESRFNINITTYEAIMIKSGKDVREMVEKKSGK